MLSEGHTDAAQYPVIVVWSEARIVRQRESIKRRNEAIVMQAIVASAMSPKKGVKALEELLKKLERSNE